jgi:hypothetical protein
LTWWIIRVEEMLPPALARELTDLFHKNMACNSSLVDYIPVSRMRWAMTGNATVSCVRQGFLSIV